MSSTKEWVERSTSKYIYSIRDMILYIFASLYSSQIDISIYATRVSESDVRFIRMCAHACGRPIGYYHWQT